MSAVALPHDVHGSGPHRVIVLHGWFGDRRAFAKVVPYLDRDAFTYAFADYRGYGQARDLSGEFGIAEIAGDVIALADKLGWEDFSLIGHSMGGSVIQRVMLDAPGRVRRLVGVNPVPASGVPFDEQGWALFTGAADEPANRRAIIDFTTGGCPRRGWTRWWRTRSATPTSRRSAPTCTPGRTPTSTPRSSATPRPSWSSRAGRTRPCRPTSCAPPGCGGIRTPS
ncbi:alpha/beta fold hydrolase [Catellatospora coxensis]